MTNIPLPNPDGWPEGTRHFVEERSTLNESRWILENDYATFLEYLSGRRVVQTKRAIYKTRIEQIAVFLNAERVHNITSVVHRGLPGWEKRRFGKGVFKCTSCGKEDPGICYINVLPFVICEYCWQFVPEKTPAEEHEVVVVGCKMLTKNGWNTFAGIDGHFGTRVHYPIDAWVTIPDNGAYVAIDGGLLSAHGYRSDEILAFFECGEPTGCQTFYEQLEGIRCYRKVRRLPESAFDRISAELKKHLSDLFVKYPLLRMQEATVTVCHACGHPLKEPLNA